jgi:hypothetical protein
MKKGGLIEPFRPKVIQQIKPNPKNKTYFNPQKIIMFPLNVGEKEHKFASMNPHFSNKVTMRRNLLNQQGELKRKYKVVNSLSDVVKQAK